MPSGSYSVPLSLTLNGKSGPTFALTSLTSSIKNLIRFSAEPPYQSVLLLVRGERKLVIKYPWAPCISTISKPATFARRAASPNEPTIPWTSSKVSSSGTAPPRRWKSSDGMRDAAFIGGVARSFCLPQCAICSAALAPFAWIVCASSESPGMYSLSVAPSWQAPDLLASLST